MWYLYIIRASDGCLYTGITTDVMRRAHEHNASSAKGSKYLRVRRPCSVVYTETFPNRSQASKREYVVKHLSRLEKLQLISNASVR